MGLRKGKISSRTPALTADDIMPAGILLPFAGPTAPAGFLLANGDAVSRVTYAKLFSAIGTTWGIGDGSTTFNVPGTQGMVLRGTGTGTISGRSKVGPALGAQQEDQMQKITGQITAFGASSGAFDGGGGTGVFTATGSGLQTWNGNGVGGNKTGTMTFSSANSTSARVSAPNDGETRAAAIGVNYIIKF